jgi:hypothetical protein
MVDGLPPIEGGLNVPRQQPRPTAPAQLQAVGHARATDLPELPPAEVLDALDTAARVLNELDRKQVSIQLEHDAATNALRAHVQEGIAPMHQLRLGALLNVLGGDTDALRSRS